jgi:hypothetical protein
MQIFREVGIGLPKFYRFERFTLSGRAIGRCHPIVATRDRCCNKRCCMALRPSLILKSPTSEYVDRVRMVATDIMAGLDQSRDISLRINALNAMTGNEYDLTYFQSFYGHTSIEEFATEASLPVPHHVPDITRDELIEIVRLAMTVDPPDSRYYRNLFDKNVPMSGASGLLDYPEDWKPGQDLSKYNPSPEEIVDRATRPGTIICL